MQRLLELSQEIAKMDRENHESANGGSPRFNEAKLKLLQGEETRVKDQLNMKKYELENNYQHSYINDENLFRVNIRDPPSNVEFHRSNVIGKMITLFDVADPRFTTAINKIGGGRLLHLVTKDIRCNEMLIKHNLLANRTTMVPLSVTAWTISDRVRRKAKEIANAQGKEVYWAMECIHFDESYRKPLEYLFGNNLICEDKRLAEMICYNPEVLANVVTLEGSVFSPHGTVSGGWTDESKNLMIKYRNYVERNKGWDLINNNLRELEHKIRVELDLKAQIDNREYSIETKQAEIRQLDKTITRIKSELTSDKLAQYEKEIEIKLQEKDKKLRSLDGRTQEIQEEKLRIRKLKDGKGAANSSLEYERRKIALEKKIQNTEVDVKVMTDEKNGLIAAEETGLMDIDRLKITLGDRKRKILEFEAKIVEN